MKLDMRVRKPGDEKLAQTMEQIKGESTYEILKRGIGGTLSCVRVNELDIWIDDEGLLKHLEPNIVIKRSKTNQLTDRDTLLVGPVVFASNDGYGDTIGLSPEAIEIVENMKTAMMGPYPIYIIEAW